MQIGLQDTWFLVSGFFHAACFCISSIFEEVPAALVFTAGYSFCPSILDGPSAHGVPLPPSRLRREPRNPVEQLSVARDAVVSYLSRGAGGTWPGEVGCTPAAA